MFLIVIGRRFMYKQSLTSQIHVPAFEVLVGCGLFLHITFNMVFIIYQTNFQDHML